MKSLPPACWGASAHCPPVAQVSKPAVSPISKSAGAAGFRGRAASRGGADDRTASGFGNPRYSRLGSLRYAGSARVRPVRCWTGGLATGKSIFLSSIFLSQPSGSTPLIPNEISVFAKVRAVRTGASVSLSSVRNGGEGRGEEALRNVRPLEMVKHPSPRPSPRSCLTGRGRRTRYSFWPFRHAPSQRLIGNPL